MRTKTKYRQAFKEGGRVDLTGQVELPSEPPAEQPVEAIIAPPEAPPATIEPPPAPPQPEQPPQPQTDATEALHRQIEALRKSEQVQRQRAAMPAQPMSREARLEAWRQQGGLSDAEIQFFQKHPEMVDHPQITGLAVNQAKQAGIERGTPAHLDFVEKAFNATVEHMMREQAQAANPSTQATPNFFRPVPGPAARSAPNPSSLVSAPVSRTVPNASGTRPRGQVKLSPSEVEAARNSNITLEEYARQKVKYETMKETGEYRDARETQR